MEPPELAVPCNRSLKFIYSEKAEIFFKISPLLLTLCAAVKSKRNISKNFVAFSEYMNFINLNKFEITTDLEKV